MQQSLVRNSKAVTDQYLIFLAEQVILKSTKVHGGNYFLAF